MIKRDSFGRFIKGSHVKTEFKKGQISHRKGVALTEGEIKKRTETRRINGWFKNPEEQGNEIRKLDIDNFENKIINRNI